MPAETPNASDCMEIAKIAIQITGYIVTWLIVFSGWHVNNRHNARRDDRKELRDLVDDISELIRTVESDIVSFLTSTEGPQTSSYWTVQFGVRQVNSAIVGCKVFDTDTLSNLLVAYRQAITDKAIQGPETALPKGHELSIALRGVSSAGTKLVRGLELQYRARYPFSK